MRIYLIKRKGKTRLGNMEMNYSLTIGKEVSYAQMCFYKRKDAINYLDQKPYNEFWEVVSADVQNSKKDNRKN